MEVNQDGIPWRIIQKEGQAEQINTDVSQQTITPNSILSEHHKTFNTCKEYLDSIPCSMSVTGVSIRLLFCGGHFDMLGGWGCWLKGWGWYQTRLYSQFRRNVSSLCMYNKFLHAQPILQLILPMSGAVLCMYPSHWNGLTNLLFC